MKYNKPTVLITVVGGVAHIVACPEGVEVILRDFDNNRDCEPGDDEYEQDFTEEEIEAAKNSAMFSSKPTISRVYYCRVHGTDKNGKYAEKTITVRAKNKDEAKFLADMLAPGDWGSSEVDTVEEAD